MSPSARGGPARASATARLATQSLGERAALGNLFDDVAIAVARGEVHRRIDDRGIFAERLVDDTHCLDEVTPVGRSQNAEAADAVADRNLIGCLPLALRLHQPLDVLAFFRKALLDPGKRESQSRPLPLQPPGQLRDERTR